MSSSVKIFPESISLCKGALLRIHSPPKKMQDPTQLLRDKGFVPVSSGEMARMRNAMDTDPVFKVVSRIALSQVLGGGFEFEIGNRLVSGAHHDAMNVLWDRFVRQMMRSMWLYGFASVGLKEHEGLGWVPYTVDMETVEVYLKRYVDGTAEYILVDHSRKHAATHPMQPRVLENVQTFEMDPPTFSGELRSVAHHIIAKYEEIRFMVEANAIAVKKAACPTVYLENTEPPVTDDQGLFNVGGISDAAMHKDILGMQNSLARVTAIVENSLGSGLQAVKQEGLASSYSAAKNIRSSLLNHPLLNQSLQGRTDDPVVYLPRNYRVARTTEAKAPSGMQDTLESYEEIVGSLLGVPRSFFSQFSNSKSGNNPDARLTFRSAQRRLKQFLVHLLSELFRWSLQTLADAVEIDSAIFSNEGADSKKEGEEEQDGEDTENDARARKPKKTRKRKRNTSTSTAKESGARVGLPGLPDEEQLMLFHEAGLLKPKVLNDYLSQIHGIPRDAFIDDPEPQQMQIETRKLDIQEKQVDNQAKMQAQAQTQKEPAKKKQKT